MSTRFWILVGVVGLVGIASAVDPRLKAVYPPGVQAGTEASLRLDGERLADTQELLFYQRGIRVTKLEEVGDKRVRATVEVAPDCALGEHHLRVRTAGGLSELRTFYVGPFPVVERSTDLKPEDPPQELPLNCTVSGSVAKETVHRYRVEARQGQRLSVEVESMRLGRQFDDPYVSILDAGEKILARSDDTALFVQDCFASTRVPADGTYLIEVRETSYGALSLYRLHVGTFARPRAVYPAGGRPGTDLEVRLIDPVGGDFSQSIRLPSPSPHPFGVFARRGEGGGAVVAPSWNMLRVIDLPNVLEAEPNDGVAQAALTTNSLPVAFNGIIGRERDVDWFRFQARKGDSFDVRVYARTLRSPLDSVLVMANAKGQSMAGNDDSGGPDSYLRFKVPEDGEYTLQVRDHLGNGGPDFTYRVEIDRVRPSVSLYVPDVRQYDTQTRKSVVVARGNRFPLMVNVRRQDIGGDMRVGMVDFPPGITMQADLVAANKDSTVLVFEAAAEAPLGGTLAQLSVTQADPGDHPPLTGGLWQNYDLVQRGNQGVYYKTYVDRLAVAVVEALPFAIRIEPPQAPLVRNGSIELKVVAERKEGFAEPIKVQFPIRPPGLNCPTEITIPKDQDHAVYRLSANGNAEIKEHNIALLGFASVDGGTAYVGSQLTPLRISESFVEGKIPLAATIQGQPVLVTCKLTHKSPFEGQAKVELVGLPPGAKTEPREITKEDQEIVFEVTTAEDARKGLHRSLFCRLTVDYKGETLSQNFGGRGTLRIDPPPPPEPEEKENEKERSGSKPDSQTAKTSPTASQ